MKAVVGLLGLVAALSVVAGCGKEPAGADKPCQDVTGCAAGGWCIGDQCQACPPCASDEVCLMARCLPADCGARPCLPDEGCVDGTCRSADCLDVRCPAGQACAQGQCFPVDCPSASCVEGDVCWQQECRQPSCVEVSCEAGQRCAAGQCLPDSCAGVVCAPAAVCVDGSCTERHCVEVSCPAGTQCAAGQCLPDHCGDLPCPYQSVCAEGACREAACVGVVCPAGQTCRGSRCEGCAEAETSCADGLDEDCDGLADCADDECASSRCGPGSVCHEGACQAGCGIDGSYYAASASNPANRCQQCQPEISSGGWTLAANGTDCGGGKVCGSGACLSACSIDGSRRPVGAANPDNACEVCLPAISSSSWTPLAEGVRCGEERVCHSNACESGCFIGGAFYLPDSSDPADGCRGCQPAASTAQWSQRPLGATCAAGEICLATGACEPGCFIAGAVVAPDAPDPLSACRSCQPASSTVGWSNAPDGGGCGSALICFAGACVAEQRACSVDHGAGTQSWTGSAWSACTPTACDPGYHLESAACEPAVRACPVSNGAGSQTWDGASWSPCVPTGCDPSFHPEAGACASDTRACPVTNGTGSQSWDGAAWGACALTGCDAAFHLEAGACLPNSRACSPIPNGVGVETWYGSSWGPCELVGCDANYHLEGAVCAIDPGQVCGSYANITSGGGGDMCPPLCTSIGCTVYYPQWASTLQFNGFWNSNDAYCAGTPRDYSLAFSPYCCHPPACTPCPPGYTCP